MIRILITGIFTFIVLGYAFSQTKETKENIVIGYQKLFDDRDTLDPVYYMYEVMPTLPGGKAELNKFIRSRPTPDCVRKDTTDGVVVLKFIVEKDGTFSNIKVVRNPDDCLAEAALNYFKKSPPWIPGKHNGEIVACLYTLPINYYPAK